MSDELPSNLLPIADFFGLPGAGPVAKDFHVVRAIAALASIDSAPFRLIFGGGTALARAHRLIHRMSEDVDFKIIPLAGEIMRRHLGGLHTNVSTTLHRAGFAFDPLDRAIHRAMDSNRYAVWQLPYDATGAAQGLRPTIKIELNLAVSRRPPIRLPVRSFVSEALNRPAEVAELPCVSVVETAAEKLVSLTRRTAMERAGVGRDPDPTLVRHIYDLHMLRGRVDRAEVAQLARIIAASDAAEFDNQFPAYMADIPGETARALEALRTDPLHAERYAGFLADMVYGERADFTTALATVTALVEAWLTQAP